uniref:G-protein coupled receptors family 1 profile domain-containing protein n=1 Tax=Sciurus vulgaris TaxID=55149 RepID=A0A8D2CYP7_SCIVU
MDWNPYLKNPHYENRPPICDMNNLIPQAFVFMISLIGLAGNTSVIWFLGFRMRRNAFYTYILNLAAADLLLLCLHITYFLVEVLVKIFHFSISTYGFIRTGASIFYIAGLNILSAISTERCLSVLWPIWYHCHRPRHTSAIMCALLWVLSMLLSILDRVYCFHFKESEVDLCEKVNITLTAWVLFSFVVLLGSSLVLLGRMLCGSKQKPLTRLYVTILLTVLVFLLCVVPFGVSLFLLSWIKIPYETLNCLFLSSLVLSSVNSSANPIIYFFVGSFRQRLQARNLKLVLERALQDTPEEDECGGSLSQGTLEMSGSRVEPG